MTVTRTALALSLAALSLGCDTAYTEDGACRPEVGCDGIVSIAEFEERSEPLAFAAQTQPEWCEHGEDITYYAERQDICDGVIIDCARGWVSFYDECGCGCSYIGGVPPEELERPDEFSSEDAPNGPEPLGFEAQIQPSWCEHGEFISYVSETEEFCEGISIHCAPGWENFDDECGCGCIYAGESP